MEHNIVMYIQDYNYIETDAHEQVIVIEPLFQAKINFCFPAFHKEKPLIVPCFLF